MSRSSQPRRYAYPIPSLVVPFLRVLLGVPSSISRDAALLLKGYRPPPRVLQACNIPPASPFILVVNHYDHPQLGAWWGIATVLYAVTEQRTQEPREVHFTMAREWWYPPGFGRVVKQPLTHWFFGQISRAYGTLLLPPVLENNEFRGQGALEIRHALALTRGTPHSAPQLVGLSPEGRTGENLSLCKPPPGAGLFVFMLTHDNIPCLPVGIYEDDEGILTTRFGAPFHLCVPRSGPRAQRDTLAAQQIMVAIGKCLPERMWGAFREDIKASL